MADQYKILYKGGQAELVEKKSRFIAVIRPAETEVEAVTFIEEMRKKYWDARHHCSAYVIGNQNQSQKCSDDGEPNQTAGRPMLDVLLGAEVHNVCAVVIRYFGGTLLGTGGLVRAYSGAVQKALKNSTILEKCQARRLTIYSDYSEGTKIQYLTAQIGVATLDTLYTDQMETILLVPVERLEEVKKRVVEATSGKSQIEERELVYYGVFGKEIIIFGN